MNLLDDPTECVNDFLDGFTRMHSGVFKLPGHRVIMRRDLSALAGKVAIVSGGGSGHEPAFAGYVGKGMLAAAVVGSIFASPPPASIIATIRCLAKAGASGVVLAILNYTGDRVNFGIAKEWAGQEGITVSMVSVGEDCALVSPDRSAGRRGLAGAILVLKVAGAMAEQGKSIEEIETVLNLVLSKIGTMGMCLKPCILPGNTSASFNIPDGQYELGLGVHGEAGVKTIPVSNAESVVMALMNHMMDKESQSRISIQKGDSTVVMVNNLGATSCLEMGVVTRDAIQFLQEKGVNAARVYSGTYMTSLQMYGVSLTILNLTGLEDLNILDYLDYDSCVASPLVSVRCECDDFALPTQEPSNEMPPLKGPKLSQEKSEHLQNCIHSLCTSVIGTEDILNTYDSGSGDGDCGVTHARGARAIIKMLTSAEEPCRNPATLLRSMGNVCHTQMGGSSGAMYGILLNCMANHISKYNEMSLKVVGAAIKAGVNSMKSYGGAELNDRTMVDVLEPLADFLETNADSNPKDLKKDLAVLVNQKAESTTNMVAKAGRASYVAADRLIYPDPGAVAVAHIASTFVHSFVSQ